MTLRRNVFRCTCCSIVENSKIFIYSFGTKTEPIYFCPVCSDSLLHYLEHNFLLSKSPRSTFKEKRETTMAFIDTIKNLQRYCRHKRISYLAILVDSFLGCPPSGSTMEGFLGPDFIKLKMEIDMDPSYY